MASRTRFPRGPRLKAAPQVVMQLCIMSVLVRCSPLSL